MPVPYDLPILDDFNRADGVVGSNWAHDHGSYNNTQSVASNRARATNSGVLAMGRWVGAGVPFNANQFAFFELIASPTTGNDVGMDLRLQNIEAEPGSAYDGYRLKLIAPSTFRFIRIDEDFQTTLSEATLAFAAGDYLLFEMEGTEMRGWRGRSGVWTQAGAQTDTTHTATGAIGWGGWQSTLSILLICNYGCGSIRAGGGGGGGGTLPALSLLTTKA